MCGLVAARGPVSTSLHARSTQLLELIRHRGPDGEGVHSAPSVCLLHTRLAILDVEASHQPMVHQPTGCAIVFNGEIYNYRELRRLLSPRWEFRTSGDTEVMLAGLLNEGAAFVERLEGMWAFAFWNPREDALLLSRDRFGKKPLYYWSDNSSFIAASELPVLKRVIPVSLREDADSTADYLRYGFYLPGTTAYRGVHELLPGTVATVDRQGMRVSRFFSPVEPVSEELARANKLESTFFRSVEKRLHADVEVGTFLSGGIDSSLVTAAAVKLRGPGVKAFTVGFSDSSYDETAHARYVADHLGVEHHVEQFATEHSHDILGKLLKAHLGQPFADPSILPTYALALLTSRYVKVALSGDGADELFSGYQRYQALVVLGLLHKWLPSPLRRTIASTVRLIPEPRRHHSGSVLRKAHLFVDLMNRFDPDARYQAPEIHSRAELGVLAPDIVSCGHHYYPGELDVATDQLRAMMLSDSQIYLPQDILAKVDRASMACSLEVRCPFLDPALAAIAFRLPGHAHRRGLAGKRLLRRNLGHLLPPSVWSRRKQGFGVPLAQWFRETLGDQLLEMSREIAWPLDHSSIQGMVAFHRGGRRDLSFKLWALYVYCLWKTSDVT